MSVAAVWLAACSGGQVACTNAVNDDVVKCARQAERLVGEMRGDDKDTAPVNVLYTQENRVDAARGRCVVKVTITSVGSAGSATLGIHVFDAFTREPLASFNPLSNNGAIAPGRFDVTRDEFDAFVRSVMH